jgi:hypothetical protein
VADYLEFGATADRLYAGSRGISPAQFHRMTVDAAGVRVDDTRNPPASLRIEDFDYEAGRIYTPLGAVLDPETLTVTGTFAKTQSPGVVLAESATNRLFLLTDAGTAARLSVYNLTTLGLIGSVTIPNVAGDPGRLLRWGRTGWRSALPSTRSFSYVPGCCPRRTVPPTSPSPREPPPRPPPPGLP